MIISVYCTILFICHVLSNSITTNALDCINNSTEQNYDLILYLHKASFDNFKYGRKNLPKDIDMNNIVMLFIDLKSETVKQNFSLRLKTERNQTSTSALSYINTPSFHSEVIPKLSTSFIYLVTSDQLAKSIKSSVYKKISGAYGKTIDTEVISKALLGQLKTHKFKQSLNVQRLNSLVEIPGVINHKLPIEFNPSFRFSNALKMYFMDNNPYLKLFGSIINLSAEYTLKVNEKFNSYKNVENKCTAENIKLYKISLFNENAKDWIVLRSRSNFKDFKNMNELFEEVISSNTQTNEKKEIMKGDIVKIKINKRELKSFEDKRLNRFKESNDSNQNSKEMIILGKNNKRKPIKLISMSEEVKYLNYDHSRPISGSRDNTLNLNTATNENNDSIDSICENKQEKLIKTTTIKIPSLFNKVIKRSNKNIITKTKDVLIPELIENKKEMNEKIKIEIKKKSKIENENEFGNKLEENEII